jgi:hypothetical protein
VPHAGRPPERSLAHEGGRLGPPQAEQTVVKLTGYGSCLTWIKRLATLAYKLFT